MSAQQIDPKVAVYAAKIAEYLNELGACQTSYGEFYVSKVEISFDGDPSGVSVIPNEFGTHSIRIEGSPA